MSPLERLNTIAHCHDWDAPILPPVIYIAKDGRFDRKHLLAQLKPYGPKDVVILDTIPVNATKFKAILSMADDDIIQLDGMPDRYAELHHGRTTTRIMPWAWVKTNKAKLPTFDSRVIIRGCYA